MSTATCPGSNQHILTGTVYEVTGLCSYCGTRVEWFSKTPTSPRLAAPHRVTQDLSWLPADQQARIRRWQSRREGCDWRDCDAPAEISQKSGATGDTLLQLCLPHWCCANERHRPPRRGPFARWRNRHFRPLPFKIPADYLKPGPIYP